VRLVKLEMALLKGAAEFWMLGADGERADVVEDVRSSFSSSESRESAAGKLILFARSATRTGERKKKQKKI